jgi:hypothetical protein
MAHQANAAAFGQGKGTKASVKPTEAITPGHQGRSGLPTRRQPNRHGNLCGLAGPRQGAAEQDLHIQVEEVGPTQHSFGAQSAFSSEIAGFVI